MSRLVKTDDGWKDVTAGGSGGGGGASDWSELQNKPFNTVGDTLSVDNGILNMKPINALYVIDWLNHEEMTQSFINSMFNSKIETLENTVGIVNALLEEV